MYLRPIEPIVDEETRLLSWLAQKRCEKCGSLGCSKDGYEIFVALLCYRCADLLWYSYIVDTFKFGVDFEIRYWVPVTRPPNPNTK